MDSNNRLEDLYQGLNEGDIVKKRFDSSHSSAHSIPQTGGGEGRYGEANPGWGKPDEVTREQVLLIFLGLRNLAKMKTSLANQLEDMKRLAEGEARDKVSGFNYTVKLIIILGTSGGQV